ncbi:MAG: peptidyl-prolyl cis-trans isomerase [Planctomycetes bacterium]|nr:peptidyl-prolyl cis-trans isomerase [Planctomycetota bacterium]
MHCRRRSIAWLIAVAMACAGCSGIPKQEPPPPNPVPASSETTVVVNSGDECCKTSIWDILGVPQAAKVTAFVLRRVRSRLGARFPGLEPQPELLPLADPANLDSPYPSVAVAAEVKAEEDAAPQKIKAITYLATIGCSGCYPEVEKALLASLDDCNEDVRYATVVALRETAGSPCKVCKAAACCSPAIMRKLEELAYEADGFGCYKETSPRVRRMARLAMRGCGGVVIAEPAPEKLEGPTPADLEGPTPAGRAGPEPPPPTPPPGPTAQRGSESAEPTGVRSVLVTSPSNCCTQRDAPPAHGIAVVVNGEAISYAAIAEEVERRRTTGDAAALDAAVVWNDVLAEAIDRKLLCQDARRAGFVSAVAQASYQQAPSSPAAVEAEARLAEQWLQTRAPVNEAVSPQELWTFYRANVARFRRPAQVRYESIAAPLAQFSSRASAREAIAYLRDEAVGASDGYPPPEIASAVAASHDWTSVEVLPSPAVKQALLTMQIGAVSPVLETTDGFLVVRMLERRPPQTLPWSEASELVRREILSLRRSQAAQSYVESLRRGAQVWSLPD